MGMLAKASTHRTFVRWSSGYERVMLRTQCRMLSHRRPSHRLGAGRAQISVRTLLTQRRSSQSEEVDGVLFWRPESDSLRHAQLARRPARGLRQTHCTTGFYRSRRRFADHPLHGETASRFRVCTGHKRGRVNSLEHPETRVTNS